MYSKQLHDLEKIIEVKRNIYLDAEFFIAKMNTMIGRS
ncbi:hypothetical protein H477_5099 [[Clostridium] sordellii ATCC 9714]|nr:hypothetical protein H477_5099 [[Clostridium] sordellii ATCC 9714] [Paeniclostridium sordellii ATCC 9714]